jgi:hypothetical protein
MGNKFILGQEDGTVAGGNARGINSVDLQTSRSAATQVAGGAHSVIAGGQNNTASSDYSAIAGGSANTNTSYGGFIGGGFSNAASNNFQTISGGQSNAASTATHATVVGGQGNTSSGAHSVSGGQGNTASGQNSIALGSSNTVAAQYSGIFSGQLNLVGTVNDAKFSVVSGGQSNTIQRPYSVIGGGLSNQVRNVSGNGDYSVIGGGSDNITSQLYSTISGGQSNVASTNTHATVVGGQSNVSSGQHSVSGGFGNTASGLYAVALGYNNQATSTGNISLGFSNTVSGNTSMAGPRNCVASSEGTVALGFAAQATGGRSYAIGSANTASGGYSVSIGANNNSYNTGMITTYMGDAFTTQGDCQRSMVTQRYVGDFSTGGTGTLNITAGSSTSALIPSGNDRAWNVQVNWVAVVTSITGTATGISVGDVITSVDLLAFKKIAGVSSASTHTSAGTKTMVTTPAAYVGCQITYAASTGQRLELTFTAPVFAGGGTVNMRVVATLELTEVAF